MARITNAEKQSRERMGEYIIESLMGQERQRKMTIENIELFFEVASYFTESGVSAQELHKLLQKLEEFETKGE